MTMLNRIIGMVVLAGLRFENGKRNLLSTLREKNGDGYIDTAVKIIISVVVGGVILAGIYALFNTSVIPTMKSKITGMFDYKG